MSEDELVWATDQIMIRSVALYGCSLPQSDFLAQFISEETRKFILEFGYPELTLEEILLALMINTKSDIKYPSGNELQPVSFSGVYFNVNFLSKVLDNYSSLRTVLERKIQNHIDGYE